MCFLNSECLARIYRNYIKNDKWAQCEQNSALLADVNRLLHLFKKNKKE